MYTQILMVRRRATAGAAGTACAANAVGVAEANGSTAASVLHQALVGTLVAASAGEISLAAVPAPTTSLAAVGTSGAEPSGAEPLGAEPSGAEPSGAEPSGAPGAEPSGAPLLP